MRRAGRQSNAPRGSLARARNLDRPAAPRDTDGQQKDRVRGSPGEGVAMKRLIIPVAIAFALISCASLPRPQSSDDSLVIGSFVVDFPDGFFDRPAATFASGVWVKIANQTRGTSFQIITTPGGYFWFMSNGSDSYSLEGFEFKTQTASGTYSIRDKIDYKWTVSPGHVHYIGHLAFTYKKPDKASTETYGGTTHWSFERSLDKKSKPEAVREYLKATDPESPWISYEVSQ
jgi:hypothetical protein